MHLILITHMKHFLALYIALFYAIFSSAAFNHADMSLFNTSNGLNSNIIYDIHQDPAGLLWIVTSSGISRYDGNRFHHFEYSGRVGNLQEAADGIFWLQKQEGGIICFNPGQESFFQPTFAENGWEKQIQMFCITGNHLYAATQEGLFKIPITRKSTSDILIKEKGEKIFNGPITALCNNSDKKIFVSTAKGEIAFYDLNTHKWSNTSTSLQEWKASPVNKLYACNDYIWICRQGGIAIYDVKQNTLRQLHYPEDSNQPDLQKANVEDVSSIDNKHFYTATRSGLAEIVFDTADLSKASFSIKYVDAKDSYCYYTLGRTLNTLAYDKTHNTLWAGSIGNGIAKISLGSPFQNRITLDQHIQVTGIAEDQDGYIWLSAFNNGLWKSRQNTVSGQMNFAPFMQHGLSQANYILYTDNNKQFWIGDERGTIVCLNPLTNNSTSYKLISPDGKEMPIPILDFCLDSRNRLWVVTTTGLGLYDCESNRCKAFYYQKDFKISLVTEDKEGGMWVATTNGLKQADIKEGKIELTGGFEEKAGEHPAVVNTVFTNNYNQLLVSYPDKIFCIDKQAGKQQEKPVSFVINRGDINCMIDDRNGNIWIGSNSGIMTLHNNGESLYSFLSQGNYEAVCRLHDGRLLWSDSKGLMSFAPEKVKKGNPEARLILSDIAIGEKIINSNEEINGQVVIEEGARLLTSLELAHANRNVTFYFASLDNKAPAGMMAYRLLPENEEWTRQPVKDGVSFTDLPAGTYTLQAKMIYPDETESAVYELELHINQHWALSPVAFLIYALLIAGIIFMIRKKQKSHQIRLTKKPAATDTPKEEVKAVTEQPAATVQAKAETPREPHPTSPAEQEASHEKRYKLLVVEDSADIRLYLKVLFSPLYDVVTAENGQIGVDTAHLEMPDLILCDIMMPVKDGYECCKELKDDPNTCHIPVIMLTAKNEDADILEGIENGADDYMMKPFNPDILKAKVRNLIKSRGELKQAYGQLLQTASGKPLEEEEKELQIEDPFISELLKKVEATMCEADFSVKKLASDMNMSQPTLYRKVKQSTGFTIVELIRSVRMKQAALLLQKQYAVQEVAERVGYNDIPTFRKHFTEFAGTTPSTYAASKQNQNSI